MKFDNVDDPFHIHVWKVQKKLTKSWRQAWLPEDQFFTMNAVGMKTQKTLKFIKY